MRRAAVIAIVLIGSVVLAAALKPEEEPVVQDANSFKGSISVSDGTLNVAGTTGGAAFVNGGGWLGGGGGLSYGDGAQSTLRKTGASEPMFTGNLSGNILTLSGSNGSFLAVNGAIADTTINATSTIQPPQARLPDRQIIRSARLTLQVTDPRKFAQGMQALADRYRGFVSRLDVQQINTDLFQAIVQLRVAQADLPAALKELRSLATTVVQDQLNAADVTDEYVDVAARIDNLLRTERELQVLLTEARQKTGKLSDVLAVQRELTGTREQIERYQGRMNVLKDQVTLSTIDLVLLPPQVMVDRSWSPAQTATVAAHKLTSTLQWLIDGAIVLVVSVLPLLLMTALAGLVMWKVSLRFVGRSRTATPI